MAGRRQRLPPLTATTSSPPCVTHPPLTSHLMLIVASSPLLRQQHADANTLTLSSLSSSSSSSSRSATSSEPRPGDTGATRLPMKIFHDGNLPQCVRMSLRCDDDISSCGAQFNSTAWGVATRSSTRWFADALGMAPQQPVTGGASSLGRSRRHPHRSGGIEIAAW